MAGKQFRDEMSNPEKLPPWLYPYILCGENLWGCVFLLAVVYSSIKGSSYKDESEVDEHNACLNYFH